MKLSKYVVLLCLIEMCGCSYSLDDYKETIRNGMKTVPHVREIMSMFPNAPIDNFITEYGFDKNAPVTWKTVAYIYGRYEFGYQVNVMIDYKENRITETSGVEHFYLWEVATVSKPTPDGAVSGTYVSDSKNRGVFGERDWNKIVAANGDFSVIGIHLITNSPVPGFNDYVYGWRKDRVQVSP